MQKEGHPRDLGNQLLEQVQLLPDQVGGHERSPRDVPPGARKAGDESNAYGIQNERHDDRDRPGRLLGGLGRFPTLGDDDVHLQAHQVGREGWVPIILALGPSGLDGDVPTVLIAQLAQALAEALEPALSQRFRRGARV
jgi:hypothetical protein